jgi:hypothetical protein
VAFGPTEPTQTLLSLSERHITGIATKYLYLVTETIVSELETIVFKTHTFITVIEAVISVPETLVSTTHTPCSVADTIASPTDTSFSAAEAIAPRAEKTAGGVPAGSLQPINKTNNEEKQP